MKTNHHTRSAPPPPTGTFDAVLMVGALSDGQVPCSAIPELLRVAKPGEKQLSASNVLFLLTSSSRKPSEHLPLLSVSKL